MYDDRLGNMEWINKHKNKFDDEEYLFDFKERVIKYSEQ